MNETLRSKIKWYKRTYDNDGVGWGSGRLNVSGIVVVNKTYWLGPDWNVRAFNYDAGWTTLGSFPNMNDAFDYAENLKKEKSDAGN